MNKGHRAPIMYDIQPAASTYSIRIRIREVVKAVVEDVDNSLTSKDREVLKSSFLSE